MLKWLKKLFKLDRPRGSPGYNLLQLFIDIKKYKKRLSDIDPIKENLSYVKITVVDKNIISYIVEMNKYLTFNKSKIPDILYRNDHVEIYFIDFLKNSKGKILLDSSIYINNLLEYTYRLILAYEQNKDRKLYQYILHVLNIFKTLDSALEERS